MTNGLKGFIVEMNVLALQLLLFLESTTLLMGISSVIGSLLIWICVVSFFGVRTKSIYALLAVKAIPN